MSMSNLVVEHREGSFTRSLRRRRFVVAGSVAAVEALLVLAGALPWWLAVMFAVSSVAVYVGWARDNSNAAIRSIAWVAAASQLIVVLVPVAFVLAGLLALVGLVVLAAIALAALLLDRR